MPFEFNLPSLPVFELPQLPELPGFCIPRLSELPMNMITAAIPLEDDLMICSSKSLGKDGVIRERSTQKPIWLLYHDPYFMEKCAEFFKSFVKNEGIYWKGDVHLLSNHQWVMISEAITYGFPPPPNTNPTSWQAILTDDSL